MNGAFEKYKYFPHPGINITQYLLRFGKKQNTKFLFLSHGCEIFI